jgi:hypothetical protein
MELPIEVMVHSPAFGLKGNRATLIRVSPDGFYEVNLAFGERTHRTLLPVAGTMVIQQEPEIPLDDGMLLER